MRYQVAKTTIGYEVKDTKTGDTVKEYDSYNFQRSYHRAIAVAGYLNGEMPNEVDGTPIESVEHAEEYGASQRHVIASFVL